MQRHSTHNDNNYNRTLGIKTQTARSKYNKTPKNKKNPIAKPKGHEIKLDTYKNTREPVQLFMNRQSGEQRAVVFGIVTDYDKFTITLAIQAKDNEETTHEMVFFKHAIESFGKVIL